jgi:hypothetical protein
LIVGLGGDEVFGTCTLVYDTCFAVDAGECLAKA